MDAYNLRNKPFENGNLSKMSLRKIDGKILISKPLENGNLEEMSLKKINDKILVSKETKMHDSKPSSIDWDNECLML